MRNRDTKLLPNRQLPGQDRVVFDYLTETSLQLAERGRARRDLRIRRDVGKHTEGVPFGPPLLPRSEKWRSSFRSTRTSDTAYGTKSPSTSGTTARWSRRYDPWRQSSRAAR